jgi:uncharacterized protein YbaR (Trm112 family)
MTDPKSPENQVAVDPRLLEILVCPVTRTALEYDRAAGELISRAAGLAYPIRDGIPIMLAEEARDIGEVRPAIGGPVADGAAG